MAKRNAEKTTILTGLPQENLFLEFQTTPPQPKKGAPFFLFLLNLTHTYEIKMKIKKSNFEIYRKDAMIDEAKPGKKAGNPILDENHERMRKDLYGKIKIVQSLIDEELFSMREEISEIIKNKNKSRKTIERTLDQLLDFMDWNLGEEEFLILNNYYKSISKKGHDFYKKEYEKMNG